MSINYFDEIFFSKYINDEDEVLDVCHKHIVGIIDNIVLWMFFGVIVPAFFYYNNTFNLKEIVDFLYFEAYLLFMYIFLLYQIFDWYNDVWIITEKGIIDLDWQLLKTNIVYIDYKNIRGIELKQDSMWDGILHKGSIIIHLEGENSNFILEEAKSPQEIVGYIQGVIEDQGKDDEEEEQTSFDMLIGALKKVVKEHLKEQKEEDEMVDEDEVLIEKIKKRKGTVDLRN
ncbi:MAG: hypothetical protein PHS92_03660 [Candidatus Gracilibacteria bacterium]|nr:hypothetical protein [Candidatus Gracilibacteria bacterium]